MSPRASLPGAEELFRRTAGGGGTSASAPAKAPAAPRGGDKSTKLQVAEHTPRPEGGRKGPKHDEKVTFYCTREDLTAVEAARLKLRSEFATSADRGRIVRAALAYVLEDFAARAEDSILLRELKRHP